MIVVVHWSSTVGRDSVEPKLDFRGDNHGSTESRPAIPRRDGRNFVDAFSPLILPQRGLSLRA